MSDDRRLPESGLESLLLSAEPLQRAQGERFDEVERDANPSSAGGQPGGAALARELSAFDSAVVDSAVVDSAVVDSAAFDSAVVDSAEAEAGGKRAAKVSFAELTRAAPCDGVSVILSAEVSNPWRSLPDPCELGNIGPASRSSTPARPRVTQRWALGALDIVDPWYGSTRTSRRLPLDVLVDPWDR